MDGVPPNIVSNAIWDGTKKVMCGLISELGAIDDAFPPKAVQIASFGMFKLQDFIDRSGIMEGKLKGRYVQHDGLLESHLTALRHNLTQLRNGRRAWGAQDETESATGAEVAAQIAGNPAMRGQTAQGVADFVMKFSNQAWRKIGYRATGDREQMIQYVQQLDLILNGLLSSLGATAQGAAPTQEAWLIEALEDDRAQKLREILCQCNDLFKEVQSQRTISRKLSQGESPGSQQIPTLEFPADDEMECDASDIQELKPERHFFALMKDHKAGGMSIPVIVERKIIPGVPGYGTRLASRESDPPNTDQVQDAHGISWKRLGLLCRLHQDNARIYGETPALNIRARAKLVGRNDTSYYILYRLPSLEGINLSNPGTILSILPSVPTTLKGLLNTKNPPATPLDSRMQMARSLFVFLHKYHMMGWVHKHLSSSSIILLHKQGEAPERRLRPFVVGFDYAREINIHGRQFMSEKMAAEGLEHERPYRHPDYKEDIQFHPRFDLYSLGLILWEISHWRRTPNLVREVASAVAAGTLNQLIGDVEHRAGKRYKRVVEACLTGKYLDPMSNQLHVVARENTSNLLSFELKLKNELDRLSEGLVWS